MARQRNSVEGVWISLEVRGTELEVRDKKYEIRIRSTVLACSIMIRTFK